MASSQYLSIFYLFMLLLCIAPFTNSAVLRSVKLKLVHIDSTSHPTKYQTYAQRYKEWTSIAAARLLKIHQDLLVLAKPTDAHEEESYTQSPYIPDLRIDPSGVFLASLGVGTDPVIPQLLALDTGSSIMLITCSGSEFKVPTYRYYDYWYSSTYSRVYCGDDECEMLPYSNTCSFGVEDCKFKVKYASYPDYIEGLVMKDTITFSKAGIDEENVTVSDAVFGCGIVNFPIHNGFTGTGIMGLSNHKGSLASQFGSQFSFCINSIYDSSFEYNSLILGGYALLLGSSTPILNIIGKIFVNLQSIMLDDEVLDIDPTLFQRYDSYGGTIIDSGAAATFLADDAHRIFMDKLMGKMQPATHAFCFMKLESSRIPTIKFIFEGGANLTQGMDAFFDPPTPTGLRCFSGIKPTEIATGYPEMRNYTYIGINALQYHNVGFDYLAGRMYISPADCENFT